MLSRLGLAGLLVLGSCASAPDSPKKLKNPRVSYSLINQSVVVEGVFLDSNDMVMLVDGERVRDITSKYDSLNKMLVFRDLSVLENGAGQDSYIIGTGPNHFEISLAKILREGQIIQEIKGRFNSSPSISRSLSAVAEYVSGAKDREEFFISSAFVEDFFYGMDLLVRPNGALDETARTDLPRVKTEIVPNVERMLETQLIQKAAKVRGYDLDKARTKINQYK